MKNIKVESGTIVVPVSSLSMAVLGLISNFLIAMRGVLTGCSADKDSLRAGTTGNTGSRDELGGSDMCGETGGGGEGVYVPVVDMDFELLNVGVVQ